MPTFLLINKPCYILLLCMWLLWHSPSNGISMYILHSTPCQPKQKQKQKQTPVYKWPFVLCTPHRVAKINSSWRRNLVGTLEKARLESDISQPCQVCVRNHSSSECSEQICFYFLVGNNATLYHIANIFGSFSLFHLMSQVLSILCAFFQLLSCFPFTEP